jgi:serine/threonine protein kinase
MSIDRVKIGDILPNSCLDDSTLTGNGIPNYKSPESIKGQKYTEKSDIWLVN